MTSMGSRTVGRRSELASVSRPPRSVPCLPTYEECLAKGTPVDVVMSADRYPAQTRDEDFAWLWLTLGRCPLLGAAEEGHLEAMRTLLDAHADVNFQDERGFHALYLGAGAGPDPAKADWA